MYGLYGLKHHIVEISGDVTDPDKQTTTRKDRATQILICEALSFAIFAIIFINFRVTIVKSSIGIITLQGDISQVSANAESVNQWVTNINYHQVHYIHLPPPPPLLLRLHHRPLLALHWLPADNQDQKAESACNENGKHESSWLVSQFNLFQSIAECLEHMKIHGLI